MITTYSEKFYLYTHILVGGFLSCASSKEPACQWRRCKKCGFNPWIRKIPWKRKWQPTPVLLLGKFHGQRSLVGYSLWGHKELDTTEQLYNMKKISQMKGECNDYTNLFLFKLYHQTPDSLLWIPSSSWGKKYLLQRALPLFLWSDIYGTVVVVGWRDKMGIIQVKIL